MPNCIEGIDVLPEKNVADYTKNTYGELFCNFLIDCICCIANGRNSKLNDSICVSNKGLSVVDYIVVPYENIDILSHFEVVRVSDIAVKL